MPTTRGRNQLLHASGTMPRRAKTKPNFAASLAMALVHPQRDQTAAVAMLLGRLLVTVVEGTAAASEIGPRAKAAASAGDDHRANRVVRIDLVESLEQLFLHRLRERVEPVRAIQGEEQNSGVEIRHEGLHSHGRHDNRATPVAGERGPAATRRCAVYPGARVKP